MLGDYKALGSFDGVDSLPRPPPAPVSLLPSSNNMATISPEMDIPRAKSPVVPNPASAYAPTLQDQWLARKQGMIPQHNQSSSGYGSDYTSFPEKKHFDQRQGFSNPVIASNNLDPWDYDSKMQPIRDAVKDEYLPTKPLTAYMPTLQEKW